MRRRKVECQGRRRFWEVENLQRLFKIAKRYKMWDRKSREFQDPSAMSGTHAERPVSDLFLTELEKTQWLHGKCFWN